MSAENSIGPIVESRAITPIFADGLSSILQVGTVTHLTFTAREADFAGSVTIERVVQVRLIVPTDQLKAIGNMMLAGRDEPGVGADNSGEPPTRDRLPRSYPSGVVEITRGAPRRCAD